MPSLTEHVLLGTRCLSVAQRRVGKSGAEIVLSFIWIRVRIAISGLAGQFEGANAYPEIAANFCIAVAGEQSPQSSPADFPEADFGPAPLSVPSVQFRLKARSVVPKAIRTLSDSCIASLKRGSEAHFWD